MISYERQAALLDPDAMGRLRFAILGCGTVGSNAAWQIAKAGGKHFTLYDMDVVEGLNIPSQHFGTPHMGMNKAEALAVQMVEQLGVSVDVETEPLEGGEIFDAEVVVMAVDSMPLRSALFEFSLKGMPQIDLVMDFRMGGNVLQGWCFDPNDKDACRKYGDTLYGEDEVVEAVCGTRTFAPVGAMSGVIATQNVTKYLKEGWLPPFYTYIDMDAMVMQTAGFKVPEEVVA